MATEFLMQILCTSRQRESLLDELEDWKSEGAMVLLSGVTSKANDGFIFIRWDRAVPDLFHQKMKSDPDVLDYLTIRVESPPTIISGGNGKG